MCVSALSTCMYVHHKHPQCLEAQKGVSYPRELELKVLWAIMWVLGKWIQVLYKSNKSS